MYTHCEEGPLQHLAVGVGFGGGIKPKLELFVVMLGQIQHDRGSLKDCEIVARSIDYSWDSSIWIDLKEPGLLNIVLTAICTGWVEIAYLLYVRRYVKLFNTIKNQGFVISR
jgi:hypothetical protein